MATCHDPEGWRVISRARDFDTSLCFEEGVLLSVLLAVLLVVATARSLTLILDLSKERTCNSRYLLRTKLALLLASFIVSISNLLFILLVRKTVPVVYYYVIEPLALASTISLTYLNHTRTRTSSSTLLIFWPLYLFSLAIWIRSVLLSQVDDGHVILVLKSVVGALGLVSFALEIFGPEYDVESTLGDKLHMESPLNTANIFSIWTFRWMTSLMKKGASQYITETDLPSLQLHDESEKLGKDLKNALEKHTLWKALFVAYGGPYAVAAVLKVFQDCLAFLQPQLLRWLLSYISWYQSARFGNIVKGPSSLEGFAIAGIMFIASVAQTVALNQYFQRTFETGMRVRAGLVTVIYAKALVLSNDERSRASGDIVNLMSVDATRLQDLCTYGLIALSGPLQIMLAFISLYDLLGCFVLLITLLFEFTSLHLAVIARSLKRMQEQQMKNRDKRTRLMSELLANIKSIKLYAWEYSFMRKIFETRNNQELKMLRKIGLVTAFNTTLWSGIPLLVGFSSFATAAAVSSKPLTSDIIFPAISLFMLLQFPLAMFSQVTSNIIEAIVSVKRLSDFLNAEELQGDARKFIDTPNLNRGDEVLSIQDADFSWEKKAAEPTLEGINLIVKKGELVGVFGRVGAGKTSLLSAIIGDMTRREGEVIIRGSIAYAPQNPWILSATVRENILFSHEYDETFYNLVIEACALGQDLSLLSQGDLTQVGEKGITLSGGQRARISLARAVYARADIVLLDDCLAAVDSHVARHVFDNVIGPHGLLATKARILVTNSIAFVKQFDQLVFIRRGIILENGSYETLALNAEGELTKLLRGHGSSSSSGTSTPFVPNDSDGSATPGERLEVTTDGPMEPEAYAASISEKLRHRTSFAKARIAKPGPTREAESTGLSKEHQEQGRVKVHVYKQYIEAASKAGFSFFLLTTILQQAASVLANFTLRDWGEHNREAGSNKGMFQYLLIYGIFSFSSTLLGGLSSVLIWVLCALRSAKRLHDGNWVVRSASEVEQNIVSVERILHQTEVQPEAPQEIPENKPSDVWPSNGEVEFRHYSTKYRPELEFVLKDISLVILLLALFRIIEPAEGKIFIDSVDITMVGLHDLRSNISIVPQSPDLFEGTLRENIDPVGEHSDADIWRALGQAHLKDYVDTLPQGLDAPSKILVLDEATSAVDLDTDRAIQEIIRGPAFADVTMLTIAHRLNTIIESDRVLVMDSGKVAEFDKPETLLAKKDTIFYSLAKEAGLV
ncbi:hypothetical protein C0992_003448 [Termitomyces sp. T32_za158]|nr:hypothetical protein C0992_003448 [Termitomyces sp. T32_za158]